jgi:aquaporin Z
MFETLRGHWPEYLMEAWGLGTSLVSADLVVTLLEYPGSPVHAMLPDTDVRRGLIGLTMGLTAVGIIYSPWGQRSGAQINPGVTLSFLRPGRHLSHDGRTPVLFARYTAAGARGRQAYRGGWR